MGIRCSSFYPYFEVKVLAMAATGCTLNIGVGPAATHGAPTVGVAAVSGHLRHSEPTQSRRDFMRPAVVGDVIGCGMELAPDGVTPLSVRTSLAA